MNRVLLSTIFCLAATWLQAQNCMPDVEPPAASCLSEYAVWSGPFATVSVHNINENSVDNCSDQANLQFAFDEDFSQTAMNIHIGDLPIDATLWVSDEAGNSSSCVTSVVAADCWSLSCVVEFNAVITPGVPFAVTPEDLLETSPCQSDDLTFHDFDGLADVIWLSEWASGTYTLTVGSTITPSFCVVTVNVFQPSDCDVDEDPPIAVCLSEFEAIPLPGDPDSALVNATDIANMSYDFCTPSTELTFSFTDDLLTQTKKIPIIDLPITQSVWVSDAGGLTDFCITTITSYTCEMQCVPFIELALEADANEAFIYPEDFLVEACIGDMYEFADYPGQPSVNIIDWPSGSYNLMIRNIATGETCTANLGLINGFVECSMDTLAPVARCTFVWLELGSEPVLIWASDLNRDSWDNCPLPLSYSFSPDVTDNQREITTLDPNPMLLPIFVTDAAGNQSSCMAQVRWFVPFHQISGRVFADGNVNCSSDAGEVGLKDWIIQATANGTDYYGSSDINGTYKIYAPPGDYTLTAFPPAPLWDVCDLPGNVSISDGQPPAVVDIGTRDTVDCAYLSVDVAIPLLRRCVENAIFISWTNANDESATNATVVVELDDYLTIVDASLPYTEIADQTYEFALGDLDAYTTGVFLINAMVSCDPIAFGQSQCVSAAITADNACPDPADNWNGAHIVSEVECAGDSLHFRLQNIGPAPTTTELKYIVIEDDILIMENFFSLGADQSLERSFEANGHTFRLESEQEATYPGFDLPISVIEGCGTDDSGNISTGFVNMFSMGDQDPTMAIECQQIIGSYDPNDKGATPEGYRSRHYIDAGTTLEYLIRFQNTGTDTAFQVYVLDTLSSHLDIRTLRVTAASHPYTMRLGGTGIMRFDFPDIELVDSTTNEPLSHGFVKYEITVPDGAEDGTLVENNASIYFDFNAPVKTNTVFHEVGDDFIEVILSTLDYNDLDVSLSIAPNPVSDMVRFCKEGGDLSLRDAIITVYDLQGRAVATKRASDDCFVFDARTWQPGLHAFVLQVPNHGMATGKLVVIRKSQ